MKTSVANVSFASQRERTINGLVKNPKDVLPKGRVVQSLQPHFGDKPRLSKASKFAVDFFATKKRLEKEDAYTEAVQKQNNTESIPPAYAARTIVTRHTGIGGVPAQTTPNVGPGPPGPPAPPHLPRASRGASTQTHDTVALHPTRDLITTSSQTEMARLTNSATSPGRSYTTDVATSTRRDRPPSAGKSTVALPPVAETVPMDIDVTGPPIASIINHYHNNVLHQTVNHNNLNQYLYHQSLYNQLYMNGSGVENFNPELYGSSSNGRGLIGGAPTLGLLAGRAPQGLVTGRNTGLIGHQPRLMIEYPTVVDKGQNGKVTRVQKFKVPNYQTRIRAREQVAVPGEHYTKGLPRDTIVRQPPPKAEMYHYDIPTEQELLYDDDNRLINFGAHRGWAEQRFGSGDLPSAPKPKRKKEKGHGTNKRQRTGK